MEVRISFEINGLISIVFTYIIKEKKKKEKTDFILHSSTITCLEENVQNHVLYIIL